MDGTATRRKTYEQFPQAAARRVRVWVADDVRADAPSRGPFDTLLLLQRAQTCSRPIQKKTKRKKTPEKERIFETEPVDLGLLQWNPAIELDAKTIECPHPDRRPRSKPNAIHSPPHVISNSFFLLLKFKRHKKRQKPGESELKRHSHQRGLTIPTAPLNYWGAKPGPLQFPLFFAIQTARTRFNR